MYTTVFVYESMVTSLCLFVSLCTVIVCLSEYLVATGGGRM